jgi:hypothetical protein
MVFGLKFDRFSSFLAIGKSRRFVIFWPRFLTFWTENWSIRIYRKTGPTKSTVLGPRPPPGEIINFIEKSPFLLILGSSIEPEKPSAKSASTPYPPQKVNFMAIFNISRPNFNDGHNLSLPRHWKCVLIFVRLALITYEKPNSFSMRARFVSFAYESE